MKPLAAVGVTTLRACKLLLLLLLLSTMLTAAAYAAPIAMVTDMQGRAAISANGKVADAMIVANIEVGTQVQLQANSTMEVVYLADGGRYLLTGPAQVVFRAAQPEVSNGPPALKLPTPSAGTIRIKPSGLGQVAVVMRGPHGTARIGLLSPNGTRVLDTQPELRWQEPHSGLRYSVEIADDTGRSLYEAQVEGQSFTLPASLQLKEGMAYTWEVASRLPVRRPERGRSLL